MSGLLGVIAAGGDDPWDLALGLQPPGGAANLDLVVTNVVPDPCRACAHWQGRVLSVSGASRRFPAVKEAEADGMFHPNCRHELRLYVPRQVPARPTVAAAIRRGRARDRQRAIERHIRRWKRREAVAVTVEQRAYARRHVRKWQAEQRRHLQATGRRRDYSRERI